MSWTINGVDFATAKVSGCTRNLTTGGGDVCLVVLDLAFDAAEIADYAPLQTITILQGGETFFSGPLAKIRPGGTAAQEQVELEIRSPWWLLEHICYTQDYESFGSETPGASEGDPATVETEGKQKSRVILGADVAGNPLTTGDQITALLEFANARCDGAVPVGLIFEGIIVPRIEMTDASVAECILQLLRFHPDAVIFCDHSGAGVGAVNVRLRASLGTLTLPASGDDSNSVSVALEECAELVPPGVAIHYERTHQVDGQSYQDIITDEAPFEGAADALGGIHFTFPLQGRNVTTQKQKITCGKIPDQGDQDAAAWKWIQGHFKGFKDALQADYIIGNLSFTQEVIIPDGADEEDYPFGYSNELLTGVIPEYVADPEGDGTGSPVACSTMVEIYLTYKGTDEARRREYAPNGKRVFTTEVLGTTLGTRTYSKVTSFSAEASAPVGLANAYYTALQTLQVAGEISLQSSEVDCSIIPGKKLVLTGGPSATGASVMQQVSQDVFSGTTNITCGPFNDALTPGDWLELQRGLTRSIQLSYAPTEVRSDAAKATKQNELVGTSAVPRNNDVSPPMEFPPFYFMGQKISETSAKFLAGKVMNTKWDASAEDPKPQKAYEEITAAAATLSLSAGDKVYAKLTLSENRYNPSGGFSATIAQSLTASFTGSPAEIAFEGEGTADWSGSVAITHDLDLSAEPDEPTITGTITVEAVLDCGPPGGGGGSGSASAGDCDCAAECTVTASATHNLEVDLSVLGIAGSIMGEVTGSVSGLHVSGVTSFTPAGTVRISPSTLNLPSEMTLKVSVWECTGVEIVKESSPESTDTLAYVPIAEAVADGDSGEWKLEQKHAGLIFWNSPPAVTIYSDAGGSGP